MVAWPSTLPQQLEQEGYSEVLQDPVARTSMDAGAPKTRLRFTAVSTYINGMLKLTAAEANTLDTFYKSDLFFGSTSFTWLHPRTGAACTMKFRKPPVFSALGAAFKADLELEILP